MLISTIIRTTELDVISHRKYSRKYFLQKKKKNEKTRQTYWRQSRSRYDLSGGRTQRLPSLSRTSEILSVFFSNMLFRIFEYENKKKTKRIVYTKQSYSAVLLVYVFFNKSLWPFRLHGRLYYIRSICH